MEKQIFPHNPFYKYRFLCLWASFFYIGLGLLVIFIGYVKHIEMRNQIEPYYDNHECDDPNCSKIEKKRLEEKAKKDAETAEKERLFREKKQKEREEKRKQKEEKKRREAKESENKLDR